MFRTVFFIVVVGMISACASKPTYELDYDRDFDFSNFKTYRWYDDVVHSRESQYRKFNSSDKRIREVVSKELAVHNLRESLPVFFTFALLRNLELCFCKN